MNYLNGSNLTMQETVVCVSWFRIINVANHRKKQLDYIRMHQLYNFPFFLCSNFFYFKNYSKETKKSRHLKIIVTCELRTTPKKRHKKDDQKLKTNSKRKTTQKGKTALKKKTIQQMRHWYCVVNALETSQNCKVHLLYKYIITIPNKVDYYQEYQVIIRLLFPSLTS